MTYRNRSWEDLFSVEVAMWTDTTQVTVAEPRPCTDDILPGYDRWLALHGGTQHIQLPNTITTDPPAHLSYLHETPRQMDVVKHALREALRGCVWAVRKGFRRAGKQLLKGCGRSLDIVGEPHRLPRLLESKGLSQDIDSIPDTDDEDLAPEPDWEEQGFMQRDFSLHDWDAYFDTPRPSQGIIRSRRSESGPRGPQSVPSETPHSTQAQTPEPHPPPSSQVDIPQPPPYSQHEYQTQYPPYQTDTEFGQGYSHAHPQGRGYSQPGTSTPILTPGEAYFRAYGVPLSDPLTPLPQPRLMTTSGIAPFGQTYGPSGGHYFQGPYGESSSSRPPPIPSTLPPRFPGQAPPPPPPGLARGRDPRQPPGASWDYSPSDGTYYRRDGQY